MKKIIYSIILCLLLAPFLTAQESTKIEKANTSYFDLFRENIFLHLNKSTYIVGENIWFKGYIYNQNLEKPYKESSNIYVGIYDSIGQQIDKKLYLGADGFFKGHIPLDSTLISGSYYIKAATNWMKNFNEDNAFVQKISIINKTLPKAKKAIVTYDFQLLPEGGYLISDVSNTVGFKVIDQTGKGIPIDKGTLLDQNGEQLATFSSNALGIGKFNITPAINTGYTAKITLADGKQITAPLPQAKPKGIALSVNTTFQDKVVIALKTNEATIARIRDQKYRLLIHKNGNSIALDVKFENIKKEILISLNKENLFNGVNIVTLFDGREKPISERLFFNHFRMDEPKASIALKKTSSDSLEVNLKLFKKNSSLTNLSISVLPNGTKSYNHKETILSTFLLRPYLKGAIENVSYYFNNINRKKQYDLDLLLLTQGWSRYEWNNIFNNPPDQKFEFESGVSLSGYLIGDYDNKKQLLLYPTSNSEFQTIDVNDDLTFEINNYFFQKNDSVKFSILDKKGRPYKPALSFVEKTRIKADNITSLISDDFLVNPENTEETSISNIETLKFLFKQKAEQLEEVTVTADKKDSDVIDPNDEEINFLPLFARLNAKKVTQEAIDANVNDLISYINSRGIIASTFNGFPNIRAQVFINDNGVSAQDLQGYSLGHFGIISVANVGARTELRLYTRTGGPIGLSVFKEELFLNAKLKHMFEVTQSFYTPRYLSYADKTFSEYGIIHWEPEVLIDENGKGTFKMIDTGLENMVLYIEGMDTEGHLVSLKYPLENLTSSIID